MATTAQIQRKPVDDRNLRPYFLVRREFNHAPDVACRYWCGVSTCSRTDRIGGRFGPEPVYEAPPAFSWTGCYVGGNAGWTGNADGDIFTHPGPPRSYGGQVFNPSPNAHSYDGGSGFIGGGQIGCNYQVSQFVLGVEGDFDGTSVDWGDTASYPTIVQRSRFDELVGPSRVGELRDPVALDSQGSAWLGLRPMDGLRNRRLGGGQGGCSIGLQ
jgi:hypothetical protein